MGRLLGMTAVVVVVVVVVVWRRTVRSASRHHSDMSLPRSSSSRRLLGMTAVVVVVVVVWWRTVRSASRHHSDACVRSPTVTAAPRRAAVRESRESLEWAPARERGRRDATGRHIRGSGQGGSGRFTTRPSHHCHTLVIPHHTLVIPRAASPYDLVTTVIPRHTSSYPHHRSWPLHHTT